jgi:hypothetical protein
MTPRPAGEPIEVLLVEDDPGGATSCTPTPT